jgi:hypothetical protein
MSAYLGNERTERVLGGVPALTYHSVSVGATRRFRRFAVDPGEFAAQLDYLPPRDTNPGPRWTSRVGNGSPGGPVAGRCLCWEGSRGNDGPPPDDDL